MTMDAKELIRAGQLDAALDRLTETVKSAPTDLPQPDPFVSGAGVQRSMG